MNFNSLIVFSFTIFLLASCANKNVSDVPQSNETAQAVANTFSADAVALAMCECMESAMKEATDRKDKMDAATMARMQKSCEKQGVVAFGNFKNDATKVAAVNAMIDENCGHLAASNPMPLQGQVQPAKGTSKQQQTKNQMADFKDQKNNKPEPKRKKNNGKKPKLEIEIE